MIPVAGDKKQFFLENLDETHRENITMPPGDSGVWNFETVVLTGI